MDNQNQNPAQLPPTPLPINPQPVIQPQPAVPPHPMAPPRSTVQPQPIAPPVQPLASGRRLSGLLPARYRSTRLMTLVVTFVMAGGGGWVATHLHKNVPLVSTTNSAMSAAAAADIQVWQAPLEQFYAQHKYYPSDITAPTLTALNIQVNQATQTAPSGTSYQYVATPVGCTTAAKNCVGYTLSAVDDNTGKAVAAIHSRSGQLQ